MTDQQTAFETINALARAFKANEAHYKSPKYSEAQARKDFIDKFWIALGWDVNHDQQSNPYEQEVTVERGVVTGGSQNRQRQNLLREQVRGAGSSDRPLGV